MGRERSRRDAISPMGKSISHESKKKKLGFSKVQFEAEL